MTVAASPTFRQRALLAAGLVLSTLWLSTVAYGPQLRAAFGLSPAILPSLYNADSLQADGRAALALVGPDAAATLAANALIRQPIDQGSLALLLAAIERRPDMAAMTERGAALLPRLGWRSSDAMALLHRRALGQTPPDYALAADYADALLRRGRAPEAMFASLARMEQAPAARREVVRVLAARPTWRLAYLAGTGALAAGQIDARGCTLQALARAGSPASDDELAIGLSRLAERGEVAGAFRLWQSARPADAAAAVPFDGDFRRAAAAADDPDRRALPFAWNFAQAAAFSVRFGSAPDAPVTFAWNGRGAPVFAWQHVRLPGARLRLLAATDAKAETLDVRLRCSRRESVRFELGATGPGLLASPPIDAAALPCRFPRLELRGEPGSAPGGETIALRFVKLTPVAA